MDQYNPSPQSPPPMYEQPVQTSGMAIASLVLGLLGFCFSPLGLIALILGIMAMSRIGNPANRQSGHGMAMAGTVLGGVSMVLGTVVLLIGLLLPALGAARRSARQMQNSSQMRGIHQGLVIYAQGNRQFYPGIKGNGMLLQGGVDNVGPDALYVSPYDGDHPAVRLEILMANDFFDGSYVISPGEEGAKSMWGGGPVDSSMYSYASLLLVGEPAGGNLIPSPQAANRNAEHRDTSNSLAVIMGDRNVATDGSLGMRVDAAAGPGQAQSIWTSSLGDWRGSVTWNDNHVSFETTSIMEWTQFGSGMNAADDSLFAADADDPTLTYDDGLPIGSDAAHSHSDTKLNYDSNNVN